MSQTTTITTTATQKRDVNTEIMYWLHVDKPEDAVVDLRAPDGMKRMEELSRLDDARKVVVKDIRGEEMNYTLERNGFQFVHQEVEGLKGLTDKDEMEKLLIPATEELVKQITGATKTIVFTHRIRHKSVDENKLQESVAPAHGAHTDFTNESGIHSLETLIKDPVEREALLAKRVRIINVWRPLKTIRKDPLAVCDWNSVKLKDDLVNNKLIFPNGHWHTLGKLAWNEGQEWMYVNEQTPEEPLLFTQWDSAKINDNEKKSTLPHTAFVDPEYIEDEARQSIEIKMWAFSDN